MRSIFTRARMVIFSSLREWNRGSVQGSLSSMEAVDETVEEREDRLLYTVLNNARGFSSGEGGGSVSEFQGSHAGPHAALPCAVQHGRAACGNAKVVWPLSELMGTSLTRADEGPRARGTGGDDGFLWSAGATREELRRGGGASIVSFGVF